MLNEVARVGRDGIAFLTFQPNKVRESVDYTARGTALGLCVVALALNVVAAIDYTPDKAVLVAAFAPLVILGLVAWNRMGAESATRSYATATALPWLFAVGAITPWFREGGMVAAYVAQAWFMAAFAIYMLYRLRAEK